MAPSVRPRSSVIATSLLVLLVSSFGSRAADAPAASVTVEPIQVRNVAPASTYIGRVQAIQSVAIVARVQAFVDKIDFQEGAMVKAGQLLFELQKAPYQAAVEAAQAGLQRAEATLRNAQLIYERDSRLGRGAVVSQSQIDADLATRDADNADVLSARANLETAAINLSYTSITSPIDGRIGKAAYTVGNLVGASASAGPLATVVQVDPIRVIFSVADRDIVSALQRTHQTSAKIASTLSLDLQLPDGQRYPQHGEIEFIDNAVDPATGTVSVWGRFANPEGLLIPGGFVSVDVQRATPEERPLVPVQAVQDDKAGHFVLLVGPDNKVSQRTISIDRQIGQDWIVTAGLKGGENVIIEGLQKVQPGQVVSPVQAQTQNEQTGSSPNGSPNGASSNATSSNGASSNAASSGNEQASVDTRPGQGH
jgi:membrane fusion protein (multidrug efflux system)